MEERIKIVCKHGCLLVNEGERGILQAGIIKNGDGTGSANYWLESINGAHSEEGLEWFDADRYCLWNLGVWTLVKVEPAKGGYTFAYLER